MSTITVDLTRIVVSDIEPFRIGRICEKSVADKDLLAVKGLELTPVCSLHKALSAMVGWDTDKRMRK